MKFKHTLNSSRSINSQDQTFNIPIELTTTSKEIPNCDLQKTISDAEQYYIERNNSCCWRFNITISPTFTNVLPEITTNNSFDSEQKLYEENGYYFYKDDECNKIFLEPYKDKFDLCDKNNWCIDLYYPSTCSSNLILNGIPLSNGISLFDLEYIELAGRTMTIFKSIIPHNLNKNSIIQISSMGSNTNYNGIYEVYKLGDLNGENLYTYFVLDVTDTIPTDLYFNRLVNNVPSTYHVQQLQKLNYVNQEIFNLGFSKNLFGDNNIGFNFCDDINLCELKDCFDKPLECIYIGIIKNNTDNLFKEVMSGFDLSKKSINFDIQTIDYNQTVQGIENNILCGNQNLICNIIEKNDYELKEYTLLDINHRFNSIDRYNNNYYEGYRYKPFYKIKIRNYSSYIEEGTQSTTANIPEYAINLDGQYRWRDLLDYGIDDISDDYVDYPFMNGCHYIEENISFCLSRQDPCNKNILGNENPIKGQCLDMEQPEIEIEEIC